MTQGGFAGDVRRRAGWLPASQDALEGWLAGHRQRVEAKGQNIELHPAVADFQRLITSDPVVGRYVSRMIDQVPKTRSYSKRHLENPDQLLRLINEVLTMAPEFGVEHYQHDSADPHWGFTSWNDFFTRRFRDGVRPVAASDDDNVIAEPAGK